MRHLSGIFLALYLCASPALGHSVFVQHNLPASKAGYAVEVLNESLARGQHKLATSLDQSDFVIELVEDSALEVEEFAIAPGEEYLGIRGGGQRGLIYAALAVAEQLDHGRAIDTLEPVRESAALPFRAIKHNLPWDSYRSSSALDLHFDTVRDVNYWEAFLDMMAQNRFNALTLWNLHPFPYMIRAHNFPEASPFTDKELAEWRSLYRAIFAMAKERGIDTYLVNWNVLVSKSFADAHKLEGTNYYPFYKGRSDYSGEAQTSDLVKRYTRESVTQILEEYPNLTGFGFSFGEQMGGMTPRERQDWMDEAIIAGMQAADRSVKMIYRAPFSAGLGQGGSTDKATEELTRESIEKLGGEFHGPIWMEIKFNWSHAHSTPDLVKVHGGELKDTYFNPSPENYQVAWMVRNEDFFALRWGHAGFIREHLQKNAQHDYVGGYFVGSESYIPAKDYFTATDKPVDWHYAFQRQWLFYKLWGRLLYNPDTPDSVFEAEFVHRYGEPARPLLEGYSLASRTQLNFASSVDFTWDFTLYGEGMMALSGEGLQPVSVERLIQQPPLRSDWLSVRDFVAKRTAGDTIAATTVTPLQLADRMAADSRDALALVKDVDVGNSASLMYEVADIKTWANLGLYYAQKLRGAVALQSYRTTGSESEQRAAIEHLEESLAYWDAVIAITRPIYRDMPLAHYNRPNNERVDDNLFHWARLRPAIARDVETARQAIAGSSTPDKP
jgi:hypothetical protein